MHVVRNLMQFNLFFYKCSVVSRVLPKKWPQPTISQNSFENIKVLWSFSYYQTKSVTQLFILRGGWTYHGVMPYDKLIVQRKLKEFSKFWFYVPGLKLKFLWTKPVNLVLNQRRTFIILGQTRDFTWPWQRIVI